MFDSGDMHNNRIFQWLNNVRSLAAETPPARFLIENKERIALFLNILWLAGCGYWVYTLITVEAYPRTGWIFTTSDPKEALAYVLFGAFGIAYSTFFFIFLIKFIYNIFHDGIHSVFSDRWYCVAKSVSYMAILVIAFIYVENIKTVGLTAYSQVTHIVNTSKKNTEVANKNISELKELIDYINNKLK